ncbi:MAG: tetratricopeptide repeat protein, partial [Nostocaceae cyanobacterium]|nr:tetratricopeptide repeat protein [Nostocaceae cyanobacterium]
EEEWGVGSFLDLVVRIFRALLEEHSNKNKLLIGLAERVAELYQMPPEVAERTATLMLKEVIGKRTLLLLVENLDELFAGLEEEGQLQLRAFLQKNSCCTILATSQSLFNGVRLQTSPFYGFFRPRYLRDLTSEEATQMLANIAKLEGKKDLEEFLGTSTGRDRIRAIHHLSGGNPRIYVIFSEFITRESLDELREPFMRMLDDLTPYYQARMQWLSTPQRKIVEILSDFRHAVTATEITQQCFISHKEVSTQLNDLKDKGYVTSEVIGQESFYELREQLMRFCLEVKKQRGEKIQLFVDFLRFWHTKEELQQRLGLGFDNIHKNESEYSSGQDFDEKLIDNLSQEKNNHKYSQQLEPLPPDALVDREYLLRALDAIKEGEEAPVFTAYWQEYNNLTDKKDYINALKYAEKLIEKRNQVQDWVLKGDCLNKLELYREALASCDKAIELNFKYKDAWVSRGRVLSNLERYEEALASCDKAIELDPNYKDAWARRGLVLNNLNCYEEALASCDKAIELDSNYKDAWARRGLVLHSLKRYEEALASCDKAIELDPNYQWAWAKRGDVLDNLNRYEEALASYEKAIELDPNYQWAWAKRGYVLNNLKRYKEALASYEKAIEIDPNYEWSWANRGDVLNSLNRYEEALASYDKVIELELNPNNYKWAWAMRGWVLNNLNRYEEALASYNKAIELNPNDAWNWAKRGSVLEALKSYEEALASYDKAIELNPNYEWAWAKRGSVLQNLKSYEEALASCNKAIELNPNDAWNWTKRGSVLKNLKSYEEALASCNKAIELNPNYEWAWAKRGSVLEALKSYEEALASCNKAIELDPNYKWAWANRGWTLINLGRYEEALASCNKAISLGENYHYVLANRAISFIGLHRWEEGFTSIEDALKSLKDGKEASPEDTELIFRILFTNIEDALMWRTHITRLIELFDKYQSISALSQGLVRSIPALISDTVSDNAVQLWLEVWQELVKSRPEFQISLGLLNAAVGYRLTKGDRRVLLELPIEERNLLEPLLDLGKTSN